MTDTPEGSRLGYEVKVDKGFSLAGAIFGGLLFGLFALLIAILIFMLMSLTGVPPGITGLVALVLVLGGVYLGGKGGGQSTEVDNVTVTVNDNGDIVMVNTNLSPGEFSRAIGRDYDRQTSQFDGAIAQVSKHWLLHKVVDKLLGSNNRNS